MHANEIAQLRNQQPFVPLRVHLSDQQSYDVRHPEMMHISIFRVTITLKTNDFGVAEKEIHVAPEHVVRIEPIEQSKAA